METMNVTFDKIFAMAFKQRSSKLELQGMTYGHVNSGLDLTCAPSTIKPQKPTKSELDLLFKAMYDDYIGGQPQVAPRTAPDALANQNLQNPNASTTPSKQQHVQQQDSQASLQPEIVADNVPNAMSDRNVFENPFAPPSTSASESSFHNISLKEDVYVCQPKGFIDADHQCPVYKLKKALNGLKQAPRAWYDELSKFLQQNHFNKDSFDPTVYTTLRRRHAKPTKKYLKDVKRIFHYLQGTVNIGLWYTKDFGFDLTRFSDADYAGSRLLQEYFRWNSILRFNTIITSLKALDESFLSRNHVRKFLRALPTKWRPKVTAIEESKDLSTLSCDELIVHGNYKPTIKDKDDKDVVITYDKFDVNQKKMIFKNDEAKMVLYNALPKKEYERIFMCNMAQDVWNSLIVTHR
nr:Gag-Pol polyprotein [Tanacetum cinerariifolium]